MSHDEKSDNSTSESELSECSSNFNPIKALYSKKMMIPVSNAPMYENISQFESAQCSKSNILPVGSGVLVAKREEDKIKVRTEKQKEIEELNKQRFMKFTAAVPAPVEKQERVFKNVLTRIPKTIGPLATLKECVDKAIRVKITTRNDKGIRGVLHATLVAFDKQWNLALTDVLEVWKRKGVNKRKIPPAMGTQVAKGTAAMISPVPAVTETPLGNGVYECARYLPQIFVRGEHVVMINIVER